MTSLVNRLRTVEANVAFFSAFQIAMGSILISFSAVFVRLSATGPTVDGYYRMLFGSACLALVAIYRKDKFRCSMKTFAYIACSGLFLSMDIICWHRSILYVGPGVATIFGNFQVFLLAFAGIIFFKERVNYKFYLALPLVSLGLYFLVGHKWQFVGENYHLGVYLGLTTALFYALCVITLKISQTRSDKLKPLPNLILMSMVGCVFLASVAYFQHESFAIPDAKNLMWLFLYGFLGQALGWLLISRGLPNVPVSLAGFLILLQPSLSFVWDILIFHRLTPAIEAMGAVVTIMAIYLSTLGRVKK